jgi:(p)ppGpp synthase/HD superfamily hydrolase
MIYTKRFNRALDLAARWHDGQYRKDVERTPYLAHLVSVALLVHDHGGDEDVVIAALLHDVLEDVSLDKASEIQKLFGKKVLEIVKGVSEPKDPEKSDEENLPWRTRKEKYLANLESDSEESLLVCAADKYHNWSSFIDSYKNHGEQLNKNFNTDMSERIWYLESVVSILNQRLNNLLVEKLESVLIDVKELDRKAKNKF